MQNNKGPRMIQAMRGTKSAESPDQGSNHTDCGLTTAALELMR